MMTKKQSAGLVAIVLCVLVQSYDIKTKCAPEYELTFHQTLKSYSQASQGCRDVGADLVNVNSWPITYAINDVIRVNETYYIGLKWDNSSSDWKWGNGDIAPESGHERYQNWLAGEPNGRDNHCAVVNAESRKQWSDEPCNSTYFYICQKEIDIQLTATPGNLTIYEKGTYRFSCYVKSVCTLSTLSWLKDGNTLSKSGQLTLKNVNISTLGTYQCHVIVEGKMRFKNVLVSVEGSPKILRVTSVSCTSILTIAWRAHPLAFGFLHRLIVFPTFNQSDQRLVEVVPNSADQVVNVTHLLPSTAYVIKIYACLSKENCPNKYAVTTKASTAGIPGTVPQANLVTVGRMCHLTWDEPEAIGDSSIEYEVTLVEKSTSTSTFVKRISVSKTRSTSHSFLPILKRNYTAIVRATSCAGSRKAINASGFCYTDIPSELKSPEESATSKTTRRVIIDVPEYGNRLISCLLLIVSNATRVDSEEKTEMDYHYSDLINANASRDVGDEYIAFAIPARRFAFATKIIEYLGDETVSWCDLHETNNVSNMCKKEKGDKADTKSRPGGIIYGKNRVLKDGSTYRIYVVAALSNGEELQFRRSSYTTLLESVAANPFVFDPTSFAIGFAIPVLLIVVGLTFWKMQNRFQVVKTKKSYSARNQEATNGDIRTKTYESLHQDPADVKTNGDIHDETLIASSSLL